MSNIIKKKKRNIIIRLALCYTLMLYSSSFITYFSMVLFLVFFVIYVLIRDFMKDRERTVIIRKKRVSKSNNGEKVASPNRPGVPNLWSRRTLFYVLINVLWAGSNTAIKICRLWWMNRVSGSQLKLVVSFHSKTSFNRHYSLQTSPTTLINLILLTLNFNLKHLIKLKFKTLLTTTEPSRLACL